MEFDMSLSASKLNVMRDCERCFFDINTLKIERPRGIFPGLPMGVDRVMKRYLDSFRGSLPPELSGKINGVFWGTQREIEKLRNWRSGLQALIVVHGTTVKLIGALDDLIQEVDSTFSPYDTKTKSDLPKDDGAIYYQGQLDIYTLLLRENHFPSSGKAYLDYWFPVLCEGGSLTFEHALYTLKTNADAALDVIGRAVLILNGERPGTNSACEYCRFAEQRNA